MNTDAIVKYAGVAAVLASLLYLVVLGKVDASLYVTIVTSVLTGLGIYHASGNDPAPAVNFPVTGKAPQ